MARSKCPLLHCNMDLSTMLQKFLSSAGYARPKTNIRM
jgi:hypothetical protein